MVLNREKPSPWPIMIQSPPTWPQLQHWGFIEHEIWVGTQIWVGTEIQTVSMSIIISFNNCPYAFQFSWCHKAGAKCPLEVSANPYFRAEKWCAQKRWRTQRWGRWQCQEGDKIKEGEFCWGSQLPKEWHVGGWCRKQSHRARVPQVRKQSVNSMNPSSDSYLAPTVFSELC